MYNVYIYTQTFAFINSIFYNTVCFHAFTNAQILQLIKEYMIYFMNLDNSV